MSWWQKEYLTPVEAGTIDAVASRSRSSSNEVESLTRLMAHQGKRYGKLEREGRVEVNGQVAKFWQRTTVEVS